MSRIDWKDIIKKDYCFIKAFEDTKPALFSYKVSYTFPKKLTDELVLRYDTNPESVDISLNFGETEIAFYCETSREVAKVRERIDNLINKLTDMNEKLFDIEIGMSMNEQNFKKARGSIKSRKRS